jgi:hypothetical protein
MKIMENKKDHINRETDLRKFPLNPPDGFFDTFHERLMSRIEEESKPTNNSLFIRYLKPAFGLIVSFAIITAIIFIPVKIIFPDKLNNSKAENSEYEKLVDILVHSNNDFWLYETIENIKISDNEDHADLENELLASLSEYEIIETLE